MNVREREPRTRTSYNRPNTRGSPSISPLVRGPSAATTALASRRTRPGLALLLGRVLYFTRCNEFSFLSRKKKIKKIEARSVCCRNPDGSLGSHHRAGFLSSTTGIKALARASLLLEPVPPALSRKTVTRTASRATYNSAWNSGYNSAYCLQPGCNCL